MNGKVVVLIYVAVVQETLYLYIFVLLFCNTYKSVPSVVILPYVRNPVVPDIVILVVVFVEIVNLLITLFVESVKYQ
tara:strand:- start:71 stop:301 length:231 start_codon:yes stop_codon:yes gene_type:complete